MKTQNRNTIAAAPPMSRARRGNVLVLVAGILVLLVIIATSYLSRTGAEREISIVTQDRGLSNARARVVAEEISQDLVGELFPRPIHPNSVNALNAQPAPWDTTPTENPNYHLGNINDPPLAIEETAARFSIDRINPLTSQPFFWWNAAPYSTRPTTNWPDFFRDPVDRNGNGLPDDPRADDIPGNPGTNDFRLGADAEPARIRVPSVVLPVDPTWSFRGEAGFDLAFNTPDTIEYHTHWLKVSNPMQPGNGWMIINDISDIEGSLNAALNFPLGPYGTPFDQWLPHTQTGLQLLPGSLVPANFDPITGKNYFPAAGVPEFELQWEHWFGNYELTYMSPLAPPFGQSVNRIPANYYRLADCGFDLDLLGGNGPLEVGERPQDEFAGPGVLAAFPDGAPRYHISRVLADADGDGYTDSFWFQAPSSAESDLKTLVAMRVVDLSSMVNLTTATQFVRGRPSLLMSTHGTRGWTPSDVALYEDITEGQAGVGLFGVPEHWEDWFPDAAANNDPHGAWGETDVTFNSIRWPFILSELGPTLNADLLDQPVERLDYWRRTGMHPLDPRAPFGLATERFTPFTMSDMLELMAYRGSNQPWLLTRLEQAVSTNVSGPNQMLRSTVGREEISEYLDQLDTRPMDLQTPVVYFDELLHDMRRQLTVFNTARNETLPPWLWWGYRFIPAGTFPQRWGWPTTFASQADRDFFIAQSQLKLDLRQLRQNIDNAPGTGRRTMPQRLIPTLMLALTDGEDFETVLTPETSRFYYTSDNGAGVFVSSQADLEDTRRAAASLASNIISWQDNDDQVNNLTLLPPGDGLDDADAFRAYPDPLDLSSVGALQVPNDTGEGPFTGPGSNERYMGLEAQPFILESFIAHVYESAGAVPPNDPPFSGEGQNYVVDDLGSADEQTTVVCVQITNPFDRPIDLSFYKLLVFGQEVPLAGILLPSTEERPRTAIIYSIATSFGGEASFQSEWQDYLDIELTDLQYTSADGYGMTAGPPNLGAPPDTILIDATGFLSKDIDDYKYDGTASTEQPVALVRTVRDSVGTGTLDVVIDRIDNPNDPDEDTRYRDRLDDLAELPGAGTPRYRPPFAAVDPFTPIFNGVRIGNDDFYVIWARATRLWRDDDLNPSDGIPGDFVVQDNERAPRYVFASHHDGFQAQSDPDLPENSYFGQNGGAVQEWTGDSYDISDDPDGSGGTPWIVRGEYADPAGYTRLNRKPVFFTCYSVYSGLVPPGGTTPLYVPPSANDTVNLADKGVKGGERLTPQTGDEDYFYPHPLQMLLKNDSYEQVGELMNVFLFGHLLDIDSTTNAYTGTLATFSEHMSNPLLVGDPDLFPAGTHARTGRLLVTPQIAERDTTGTPVQRVLGQVLGVINGNFNANSTSAFPALPAGARVLAAFVCDGPGYNAFMVDANNNGILPFDPLGNLVDPEDLELQTFYNAAAFSGAGTPGLININTASIEVFRALPHLYRLVHEDNLNDSGVLIPHLNPFDAANYEYGAGRGRLPEAIAAYRERLGDIPDPLGNNTDPLAMYGIRGLFDLPPAYLPTDPLRRDPLLQSRGDRGFESIGEIALLERPGRVPNLLNDPVIEQWNRSWRADQAGLNHLASTVSGGQVDMNLSTDLHDRFLAYDPVTGQIAYAYDETANDDEEANLLFAGLSNLITTRSDSFVVYLRIRNVRQGSDGRWNGLDPALLVDDLRYIMVVDRSNVNKVSDKPRILLFEELPN